MVPAPTCQEFVELVTDYLEGATSPAVTARVDAHLGRCSDCRTYLAQMRHTVRALGALPPEPVSPAAERDLLRLCRRSRLGCGSPPRA